ncbi:MAG: RdgB/HAM1 family non-canonical purine NTP pyrophosphatase [Chlorobi bacterium]|nr:RdgB/HAM1 family non-canonical purine NTP pyrophosphatase [Chlorobiota bacterium]
MRSFSLVLATRNPHKVAEVKAILSGLDLDIRELPDKCAPVEETGATLEENALLKARAAFGCTGLPSVADDTGLEVYYLLGEPGVRSARYAGDNATYEDNVRKLLWAMRGVPERRRHACFRTVVAYVDGRREITFEGRVEGKILAQPRGSGGFGYDPVFQPLGSHKSYAEMSDDEKNSASHRAAALHKLMDFLRTIK